MKLLQYFFFACILFVHGSCRSQQKNVEWPFQVSLRMATMLIQGDTGTVITEWIFYYDGGHHSPGRGPKIIGLMGASLRV